MYDHIRSLTKDKTILILGFGKEGRSTYRLLDSLGTCKSIAVADKNPVTDMPEKDLVLHTGDTYQAFLDQYDIVFKSPGIVLENDYSSYRCRITSQTELFLECCSSQTIGITGTKGKSTTATLLHHILQRAGIPCILAGNIGIPMFDILDKITENTKIVCELSCHQLEYTQFSPHTAVLINIHEEHLDHYGSFEKYRKAKENIYRHQVPGDILVCGSHILPLTADCPADCYSVGYEEELPLSDICIGHGQVSFETRTLTIPPDGNPLTGRHNLFNIGINYALCSLLHIKDEVFLEGLRTYHTLPHRLEFIGCYGGILYYDDSISTICDTTIQALNSLPKTDTVLIGGMDRGIDYKPLITYLHVSSVPHIIAMGDTGKRIYQEILACPELSGLAERLSLSGTLREAVSAAKRLTPPGGICLLSPAAASYGTFRNFEERGDCFKAYASDQE